MLANMLRSLWRRATSPVAASLSDNDSYPAACARAARDSRLFACFRSEAAYTHILEHVGADLGAEYLRLLAADRVIMEALDEFRRNDDYGGPQTVDYPGVGRFSPTTLRYIKVLKDLKTYFGSLDAMRICEIGVGYGGQCRVIHAVCQPAAYVLVDLPQALLLAQRYLSNFSLPHAPVACSMAQLAAADYGLVISNYAFTELTREIQDEYLSKVILRAQRGYITYNEITPPSYRSYRAEELLAMIPGARRLPEAPLTHPANCIIQWGP